MFGGKERRICFCGEREGLFRLPPPLLVEFEMLLSFFEEW
jgi:hypothetical protein